MRGEPDVDQPRRRRPGRGPTCWVSGRLRIPAGDPVNDPDSRRSCPGGWSRQRVVYDRVCQRVVALGRTTVPSVGPRYRSTSERSCESPHAQLIPMFPTPFAYTRIMAAAVAMLRRSPNRPGVWIGRPLGRSSTGRGEVRRAQGPTHKVPRPTPSSPTSKSPARTAADPNTWRISHPYEGQGEGRRLLRRRPGAVGEAVEVDDDSARLEGRLVGRQTELNCGWS